MKRRASSADFDNKIKPRLKTPSQICCRRRCVTHQVCSAPNSQVHSTQVPGAHSNASCSNPSQERWRHPNWTGEVKSSAGCDLPKPDRCIAANHCMAAQREKLPETGFPLLCCFQCSDTARSPPMVPHPSPPTMRSEHRPSPY